jgi:hypothetical protein
MRTRQIFRRQAEGKRTYANDLQSVIVDGNAYRSATHAVVAMAQGVRDRFAQGLRGIERIVDPLVQIGHHSAGHRQVVLQEALSPKQQLKRVSDFLPVVDELGLVDAPESRHP